jgi:hypothetical protein
MGRAGKFWDALEFFSDANQEHALTRLWNAVVYGVQRRVAADETQLVEIESDLLGDIASSGDQRIGDVLDKDRQRLQFAHPRHPALVESCPWIFQKCLGVTSDFAELRATDAGKRLAGRATDPNVYRGGSQAKPQPVAHTLRRHLRIGQILR